MTRTIRLLHAADASALVDHSLRCMATSGVAPTPLFVAVSRRDLLPHATIVERNLAAWAIPVGQPGWGRCFGLIDASGHVRGEAGMRWMPPHSAAHRATIWLGLELEARSQGDGRRLMETLIDWAAKSTELAWLDLGVFAENYGARRLYERLGFLETGRVVDAFRVDGASVDDIRMSLDLRQYRWRQL